MNIEIYTNCLEFRDNKGFPKTLHNYNSDIIPQIGSWIALGKGTSHPTWKVCKVIYVLELNKVMVEVDYGFE